MSRSWTVRSNYFHNEPPWKRKQLTTKQSQTTKIFYNYFMQCNDLFIVLKNIYKMNWIKVFNDRYSDNLPDCHLNRVFVWNLRWTKIENLALRNTKQWAYSHRPHKGHKWNLKLKAMPQSQTKIFIANQVTFLI